MSTKWLGIERGVERTRGFAFARLGQIFAGSAVDASTWDALEEVLLAADVGVATTSELLEELQLQARRGRLGSPDQLISELQIRLIARLESVASPQRLCAAGMLNVLLMVGVNGVGKTTSSAKLATYLRDQGFKVMLVAADTFRAAGVDQLKLLGERAGVHVVASRAGADPASVVFDGVVSARAKAADVVVADTAGRLHTKTNLMDELGKIRDLLDKQDVNSVSTILVLDATTGQNALPQAREFTRAARVDGLFVAKLDGTAKGGVVFSLVRELAVPVFFVGTGEGLEDMSVFDPRTFVRALFGEMARV